MTYAETRAWLDSLGEFHMALGLDRMRACLERLGDPHRSMAAIHVGGTNGKGATAAYASSILRLSGKKVGLYTSPHLSRPNERIAIAGKPIPNDEFAAALTTVRNASEPVGIELTFFEVLTAAAFVAFKQSRVDAMVVEVGLGGRLDATNLIQPKVSVITSLSLDHTRVLGDTIEKIATEKAGIVKPATTVVCGARDPKAAEVVEDLVVKAGSKLLMIERDFRWTEGARGTFSIEAASPIDLVADDCRLRINSQLAAHQRDNAAMAAVAAKLFDPSLDDDAIRVGLASAVWPGRNELLVPKTEGVPPTLLDGAHNPAAMTALCRYPLSGRTVVLFASMNDKDHRAIFEALAMHRPWHVVFCSAGLERSANPDSLAAIARPLLPKSTGISVAPSVEAGVREATAIAGAQGLVLVTGSLYLVGRVRESMLGPVEALG